MTVRLVADAHIARRLIVGLRRRVETADIVRVQDVGLRTVDDQAILQWAADNGRAVITQDIRTMPDFAHERIAAGLPMPGIFVLPTTMPIGTAIEELSLMSRPVTRTSGSTASHISRCAESRRLCP